MQVMADIHSLKDRRNDCNFLDEVNIIKKIDDNVYLAEYNGVHCKAIFNPFFERYYVDDIYGVLTDGGSDA